MSADTDRGGLPDYEADELAEAAEQVRYWTDQRNHRLRMAAGHGATYRELGRAVGLSHTAVRQIVTRRPADA